MTKKERFKRYLLDGGFTFGDEYIAPVWAITDTQDDASKIHYLEFTNKEVCDYLIDYLNKQESKIRHLNEFNVELIDKNVELNKAIDLADDLIESYCARYVKDEWKTYCHKHSI